MRINTRKLAVMAMLVAIGVVLCSIIRFPLIPAASFLEYDPADIPILIGTFAFGPLAGLLMTIVIAVVQGLTVSAKSGLYGILMHIIATGTYVLVAGNIYRRRDKKHAILALVCGTLAWAAIMVPANLIVTPYFTGWPREAVAGLILPGILPFNFIKAGINSLVTFFVYKRVSRVIHKFDGE